MPEGGELEQPVDRKSEVLKEMKDDTKLLVKMGLAKKIIARQNELRGTNDPPADPETYHFHLVYHPSNDSPTRPGHISEDSRGYIPEKLIILNLDSHNLQHFVENSSAIYPDRVANVEIDKEQREQLVEVALSTKKLILLNHEDLD